MRRGVAGAGREPVTNALILSRDEAEETYRVWTSLIALPRVPPPQVILSISPLSTDIGSISGFFNSICSRARFMPSASV